MTETRPFTSVWSDLAATEFSQGFIDAGGYRTRYLHAGDPSKPTLILLHGITGHAEAYVRNLKSHAEFFSVWAIDFIGHGYSAKPNHPLEIKHYVDQVMKFMDAIGVEHAYFSGRIPGWVDRGPVGDRPPGEGGPGGVEHHGRHDGQPEGDGTALHPVDGGGERPVLGTGPGPAGVVDGRPDDGHRRSDQDPAGDLPAAGLVAACEANMALQNPEIRKRNMISDDDLRSMTVPALVLWTTKDPSGPVDEGRRISELIPGGKLAVMEECGHWPQYEDTETFNKIHLDFLLDR